MRFNPLKIVAAPVEPANNTTAPEPETPVAPPGAPLAVLTPNKQKDGLELRFAAKPPVEVLDLLKQNGWRWSRFSVCWYHRNTPENEAFAQQFVSGIPHSPIPIPQSPKPETANAKPETTHSQPGTVVPVQFSAETQFTPPVATVPLWKQRMLGRLKPGASASAPA